MTASVESQTLPSYAQPPITEVACSVLFRSLEGLLSPHIGSLWQRFQPEYPFCDDVVPIAPTVEFFSQPPASSQLRLSNVPPLPRAWFISQDQTRIIQIQRDRFVHNWRKVGADSEYPRYASLILDFQEYLKSFDAFLMEADLEQVEPIQYELTYVNQIPQGHAWTSLGELGKVFPDVGWSDNPSRFLAAPKNVSWVTVFDLPDEIGRLHVSVRSAIVGEQPSLVFELTVRGIGRYNSREILKNWFDEAHEWIVRAFTDLTSEEIQSDVWIRRK